MDPSPHQSITAARQLSLEECLAFIEKLERENAQKDTEINHLKEALEREKEQREKQLGDKGECNILALINALTSRTAAEGFDNLDEQPPTGIELVVRVYPHLKAETQIEFLSHLLMLCTSYQEYESQLDSLITHPSLEVRLLTLTRWFELLYSSIEKNNFEVAIKSGGFTTANIRSNLLTAFSLIIEHENEDLQPLVEQLLSTIRDILDAGTQQFFTEDHKQTIRNFHALVKEQRRHQPLNSPRSTILNAISVLFVDILDSLLPAPSRAIKSGNRPPPK
ncbi:hypothetical protein BLNAU_21081 [Blattamonas nauphoetae]|uniref:Uncharacterized protein n=1 Tax=Blattamonas nauphoetae TaxID=2049346 RepID=A0ABQ9WZ35_9EUKA|nr:hypothetical protein BLNAU_21081 [Blattamonas nauphoetae]